MGLIIQTGGGATGTATVNTQNELRVALQPSEFLAGFATAASEVDPGVVTGYREQKSPEVSQDYRSRTAIDTLLFSELFPGSALSSAIWNAPVTTATVTVAGGNVNLNAGLSTASGAVARVSSWEHFPINGNGGATFAIALQRTQSAVTNNISEWGAIICTGTSAPTDGAFFRLGSDGSFRCFVNNNGTEAQSADLTSFINNTVGDAYWPVNTTANFQVEICEDFVFFWIMPQGINSNTLRPYYPVLLAQIPRPAGFSHVHSGSLPVTIRTYNTAATGSAQSLKVSRCNVFARDFANPLSLPQTYTLQGRHIYQGQVGGTMGSLAQYANSANPTAAVPTNTTAALATGLGGQFWETDTLAVTTDGIVMSYQNPAASATQPGRTIMITGIKLDSYIQTVLTGGGYVAQWSLAFGSTNVSLATAEAATAKAPRRIALGIHTVAAAAAALTTYPTIQMMFPEGIPVHPGEFVQLVKKKVGTAPTAGVVAHTVGLSGYMI